MNRNVIVQLCCSNFLDHGLAVRAVGIRVSDAVNAFAISTSNGAIPVLPPTVITDRASGKSSTISEIQHVGDVVIRWISGDFEGPMLPNYEDTETPDVNFGIVRLDHAVSNVPKLFDAVDYLVGAIGFHEFSEFTAEDVGTGKLFDLTAYSVEFFLCTFFLLPFLYLFCCMCGFIVSFALYHLIFIS